MSSRSAMYSSESGFEASRAQLARRRTASFTICTISPSSVSHSSRGGRMIAVPAISRCTFGIWRGSYLASCTGGRANRRASICPNGRHLCVGRVTTPRCEAWRGARTTRSGAPRCWGFARAGARVPDLSHYFKGGLLLTMKVL
eukprot:scaffold8849_cov101-Isochrysis_galbana.AAC.6